MLLAIDVGNSNCTLGVFRGEVLVAEFRRVTDRSWTGDELTSFLRRELRLRSIEIRQISAAVLVSVVPSASLSMLDALRSLGVINTLVVGHEVRTGLILSYEPPSELGPDRIVVGVAAQHLYGQDPQGLARAVIVVDLGTATTFDLISARAEHLGGAIAPGIGISSDALHRRAERLPCAELRVPLRAVGRNTVEALQSGIVLGHASLVEGMVARIRAEIEGPIAVVMTGGFAQLLASSIERVDAVHDSLMLEGLRLIFMRNLPS